MLQLLAARAARGSKRRQGLCFPLLNPSSRYATTAGVGIAVAYQQALESGTLSPDASQQRAVEQLSLLQAAVVDRSRRRRRAAKEEEERRRQRLQQDQPEQEQQHEEQPQPQPTPACLGAYLWGDVGTGKTRLADLFLSTLPRDVPRRRDHFHSFMLAFHRRQHELLESLPKVAAPTRQGGGNMRVWRSALPEEDPILMVAREIALGCRGGGGDASSSASSSAASTPSSPLAVLCLDELHVTDVADAMILSRLFSALTLDHGVAVLFTSNRPPWQLYEGGLSRKFFLPFVRLCESRLLGLRIGGDGSEGGDYRRGAGGAGGGGGGSGNGGGAQSGAMFVGIGADNALETAWGEEARRGNGRQERENVAVPVPAAGRDLLVPRAVLVGGGGGDNDTRATNTTTTRQPRLAAARFTFDELCGAGAALSSADYCALVAALTGGGDGDGNGALFVSAVPAALSPGRRQGRDEARRLVTLLDVLCDAWAAASGQERGADAAPPRLFLAIEGGDDDDEAGGGGGGPDALFEPLARERAERGAAVRGAGEQGDGPDDDGDDLPASLYAEEALMYRRAASRLAGLCGVVRANGVPLA